MSFTSYELLKQRIDSAQLDVLVGDDAEASAILLGAIDEADAIIFAYTGIVPCETNHRLLVGAAGDIAIKILSGQQTQLDEHELVRRQRNYDNAIRTIESIRDGKITIGIASVVTEESTKPTVSSAYNRMTNY